MPKFAASNIFSLDPEFRKAHDLDNANKRRGRYAYGKNDQVLIAQGTELLANGLCLRMLPICDGDNPRQPAQWLESNGVDPMPGDWQRLWVAAHWVGNPGICFNIHDGNPAVNLYESPLHVLRNCAYNSSSGKDAHPTLGGLFSDLLQKSFNRDSHVGSLRRPEKVMYLSAGIVTPDDNGEPQISAFSTEERKNARIIGLKVSAQASLLNALRVTGSAGELAVRDMLAQTGAQLLTLVPQSYKTTEKNVIGEGINGPQSFACPPFARGGEYVVGMQADEKRSGLMHFVIVHDQYNGRSVDLSDSQVDQLLSSGKTFDDYLWLPSYEEQAELLAPVFPREALDYAWRDFPEYIRALPTGATTVTSPGNPARDNSVPVTAASPQLDAQAPWVGGSDPKPQWASDPETDAEAEAAISDLMRPAANSPASPSQLDKEAAKRAARIAASSGVSGRN